MRGTLVLSGQLVLSSSSILKKRSINKQSDYIPTTCPLVSAHTGLPIEAPFPTCRSGYT